MPCASPARKSAPETETISLVADDVYMIYTYDRHVSDTCMLVCGAQCPYVAMKLDGFISSSKPSVYPQGTSILLLLEENWLGKVTVP